MNQIPNNQDFYRNLFSLQGRIAVVTGGAGHLGSEISKALASHGANVVLIGKTEEKLRNFVEENNPSFDNKFEYFSCDVNDAEKFGQIINEVVGKHGRIDILVNAAYYHARKNDFLELTEEEWNRGLQGTLTSVFTCIQKVIPAMLKQGNGSIINLASLYSFLGTDQRIFLDLGNNPPIHYSAAKGAILQLTKYLATQYASRGIRVNSLSPGYFPKMRPGDKPRSDYIGEISRRTPMARIGSPEEIAGAAVFLASDASSHITGQNIIVDGGWSSW